jgi:xanthine dehydrogenase YagS FAD-binding subunit
MKNFKQYYPTTVDEAAKYLKENPKDTYIVGGGTDVIGAMKDFILPTYPVALVSLDKIPGLTGIKEEGDYLIIGAMTKVEDLAMSDLLKSKYTCLAEAASRTASPHLRESGTVGGNLCQMTRCWYFRHNNNQFDCVRKGGSTCYALTGETRFHSIFGLTKMCAAVNPSDLAPAMVALNAVAVTNKKEIPIEKLWSFAVPGSTTLDHDEIITSFKIPKFTGKSCFYKASVRRTIDFPIVNGACAIDASGNARICLNAVAMTPHRCTEAEETIKGKSITESLAAEAGAAAVQKAKAIPGTGTSNEYKIEIAKGVIKKVILGCK